MQALVTHLHGYEHAYVQAYRHTAYKHAGMQACSIQTYRHAAYRHADNIEDNV